MNRTTYRTVTVAVIVVVVVIVIATKGQKESTPPATTAGAQSTPGTATVASPDHGTSAQKQQTKALPQVIDLGRGTCIPCKMMKPILDELAKEYDGRAIIKIIDIGEQPDEADKYNINLIPTQIFINAEGKEIARHEGFMPKEDIVAKLKEMGVE